MNISIELRASSNPVGMFIFEIKETIYIFRKIFSKYIK